MAVQNISYTNKVTSQTSTKPANEKWVSADANEVKTVVNNNATEQAKVIPVPSTLVDGAAVAFDLGGIFFDFKQLETVEAAITLTLSNVIQGANQILSVKKNIAGDVTITLAGSGLTFYGYNNADLNTTPDLVLSGASGDIFDISFLARTDTEIGVAIGLNGN